MSGGPNGFSSPPEVVKSFDFLLFSIYSQVTLPNREDMMVTTMRDEITVGGMVIRFLIEGDESGGSVAVFEFDVPTGTKVAAAHSHDGYDETVYGLEGALSWTVEGTPFDIGPGQALFIPRGVVHQFDNRGGVDAKALAVVTPGILRSDYFREVGAILAAAAGGPPDLAALGEVMRRHGLTPAR